MVFITHNRDDEPDTRPARDESPIAADNLLSLFGLDERRGTDGTPAGRDDAPEDAEGGFPHDRFA